jgi:hypothetical protein
MIIIISMNSFLMRNVSDISFRENRICILYSITSSENVVIYETMSKNMVEPYR